MTINTPDEFDEFKDRRFADWRRVRLAIEHENTLVNHRITWLLTSQAFVISATVAIFNEALKPDGISLDKAWILLSVISIVSLLICFAIGRALMEADKQLDSLDKWWYQYWNLNNYWTDIEERQRLVAMGRRDGHPEIQGRRREKVYKVKWISGKHSTEGIQVWPSSTRKVRRAFPKCLKDIIGMMQRPARRAKKAFYEYFKDGIQIWPFTFQTVVLGFQILWSTLFVVSLLSLSGWLSLFDSKSSFVEARETSGIDRRLFLFLDSNDVIKSVVPLEQNATASSAGAPHGKRVLHPLASYLKAVSATRRVDSVNGDGSSLQEVLAKARSLKKVYPSLGQDIALVVSNYGAQLAEKKCWNEAEIATSMAVDELEDSGSNKREVSESDKSVHDAALAASLNNLGVINRQTRKLRLGDKHLLRSIKIYSHLAKSNPAYFEPLMRVKENFESSD